MEGNNSNDSVYLAVNLAEGAVASQLTGSSSNWKLFKRSLANHPGLTFGFFWPLLILGAIYSREDAASLPITRVLVIAAIVGALPWIPILITAWNLRHQYKDIN